MPLTKHHLYPQRFIQLSNTFKVLACPAQLTILKYLLDHGSSNNKELGEHLGLSQSTLSAHIKQLKSIDLMGATQLETSMIDRVNDAVWPNMPRLHALLHEEER